MSGEAKIAFGEAKIASGNNYWFQESYDPLDYLLIMRDINGHNRLLKEAITPTKR